MFSRFALKTVRASTLQRNQGNGRLQKDGFLSTRMRNSYFNISLAWKRPFSLIVDEQVSIYSVYAKLQRCQFQKLTSNIIFESIHLQKRFQSLRVNASCIRKLECAFTFVNAYVLMWS